MGFLCAGCRRVMCEDCRAMAEEYEELLQGWKRTASLVEGRVGELERDLVMARRAATDWERLARLGYPEVIGAWMEEVMKSEWAAEAAAAIRSGEGPDGG